MAHSKEKTEQINMRVSDYDLYRLAVIQQHLDKKNGWQSTKRPEAIWTAVEFYLEHNKLHHQK